jgi:hypothetical protein
MNTQFNNNELQKVNSKNLETELKIYWKSLAPTKQTINNSERLQGTILRFLNNNERGKDGFLKCGNNEYYFSLSSNFHLTPQIDINSKVVFEVHSSSNGKKDHAKINKILE